MASISDHFNHNVAGGLVAAQGNGGHGGFTLALPLCGQLNVLVRVIFSGVFAPRGKQIGLRNR